MAKDYLDSWDGFEAHQAGGKIPRSSIVSFDDGKKARKNSASHDHVFGERCYHTHHALKLPGTELVIYGGSCSTPAVHDADVYIGFDHGMKFTARHWPWRKGDELLFAISDMQAPKNPKDFKALVGWTKAQLEAGKKVHCGCIGGHGRTGTFFAALVAEFGEKDAIAYVRKHYCDKAVESHAQTAFLSEHFGVTPAKGAKSEDKTGAKNGAKSGAKSGFVPTASKASAQAGQGGRGDYRCVPSPSCIWG